MARRTRAEEQRLLAIWLRENARTERILAVKMRAAIRQQGNALALMYARDEFENAEPFLNQQAVNVIIPALSTAYLSASRISKTIAANELFVSENAGNNSLAYDMFIRQFASNESLAKSSYIQKTAIDFARSIIADNIGAGQGIGDIAAEIRRKFIATSGWRALTIARTEVHSASNYAAIEFGTQSGVATHKEWTAVEDERTREAHAAMNSEPPIPVDNDFFVGDEYLSYPADPNGSPENVINCRCKVLLLTL